VDRGGKPTKMPFAIDGQPAKSNDPSTWMTRAEAERALVAYDHGGINMMMGGGRGGVDMDACIGDEGDLQPWAKAVVVLLNSYTEITPSGTGLRIFFTYPPELAEMRWEKKHVQKPNPAGGKDFGIEFYLERHPLSVTDDLYQSYDTLREIDLDTIERLQVLMRAFTGEESKSKPNGNGRAHDPEFPVDETERLYSAIDKIANVGLSWEDWNTRGMAIWHATAGSARGYDAFIRFSQRALSKDFSIKECQERWRNWGRSPPNQLTEGSIFFWARENGWQEPRRYRYRPPPGQAPYNAEPDDDDEEQGYGLAEASAKRWVGKPVPKLDFVVADLFPHRVCSLVGGDSGSGKSILLQTVCTCVAAGVIAIGQPVPVQGTAVYLTAEDPEDMLHARQDRICNALNIPLTDVADSLIVRSMADYDMWLFGERGPTSMALRLITELEALPNLRFLAIDSAALVFDEEEIRRRPVAAFMKYLNLMSRKLDIGIALIAHTSRTSKGDIRSMVSGSTAWVAQSRAGLLLTVDDDDEAVKLSLIKPNYSKRGIEIMLKWNDDGVLIRDPDFKPGVDITMAQTHLVLDEIGERQPSKRALSLAHNAPGRSLRKFMLSKKIGVKSTEAADRVIDAWLDNGIIEEAGTAKFKFVRVLKRPQN
jgi:hypothetical protein